MLFSVKNFGAIREATIDLSHDCIILAGQNNTGKTYLAYLIYALYNEIAQEKTRWTNLSEKAPLPLKNFVEKELKKNLHRYFATEKQPFEQTILKWKTEPDSKGFQSIGEQKIYIFPSVREGIQVFGKELSIIKNKTFDLLLSSNANARSQHSALLKFLTARFNKYPLAIQKSIEQSLNLDAIRTQRSEFGYLADLLEKSFLQGNVQINTEGDILFQPTAKIQLAIHQTSSTVKSLSLLVVYLRHQAMKGDFLIIDEPELNLHADNQVQFARFFGRLVQAY
jgi:predicted ATPase